MKEIRDIKEIFIDMNRKAIDLSEEMELFFDTIEEKIEEIEKKQNSEEFVLERLKELQKSGSIWFKNQIKNINTMQ